MMDIMFPTKKSPSLSCWSKDLGLMGEREDEHTKPGIRTTFKIVANKLELHRELTGYFSLFLIQNPSTVLKRVVEFELPYVTLYNMKAPNLTLEIRKWYVDPSLDKMLFDSQAAVTLLYLQALQEIERQWSRPTHEQLEKLHDLEKAGQYIKIHILGISPPHQLGEIFEVYESIKYDKAGDLQLQFLELMQDVQLYGHIQFDPCTIDCPGPDCEAVISVGNEEIQCNIQGSEEQDYMRMNDQKLELRFEYGHGDSWKWITIFTKQAFLLSSCLQKMFTENLLKQTKASVEMIEVPPIAKEKKSIKTYDQMAVHVGRNRGNDQFSREEKESGNLVSIGEDDL